MYKITKVNNGLVQWLLKEGADKHVVHDFTLSKGMGERLELRIINDDVVEIAFYGKSDIESESEGRGVRFDLKGLVVKK